MEMNVNSDLIRELRLNKSWSQEKLAEEAGLSMRTVQRIETDGIASLKTREAVASVLGVSAVHITESATVPEPPLKANPEVRRFCTQSVPYYYLLRAMRGSLLAFCWMGMASAPFALVMFPLSGYLYWEQTPFSQLENLAYGAVMGLCAIPSYLLFRKAHRALKNTEIVLEGELTTVSDATK